MELERIPVPAGMMPGGAAEPRRRSHTKLLPTYREGLFRCLYFPSSHS